MKDDRLTLPLSDFLQMQREQWGTNNFNVCEWLNHGQMVSLYLDYDDYTEDQITPQLEKQKLDMCMDTISSMFEGDANFLPERDVIVGFRHGWIQTKNANKISFRFFIPCYKLLLEDVPKLLAKQDTGKVFDRAPYSSLQKLNVPGACKGGGDTRTLELKDKSLADWCLAQRVREDAQLLEGFDKVNKINTKKRQAGTCQEPPVWEEAFKVLEDLFDNPRYISSRPESLTFTSDDKGLPCPLKCGHIHDSHNYWIRQNDDGSFYVKSYSDRCQGRRMGTQSIVDITPRPLPALTLLKGLSDFGLGSEGQAGLDCDDRQCNLVRQHLETCPTCASHHDSDIWYIYPIIKQCWSMRNSETRCTERLLPYLSNPHLESLQTDPCSDRDWAELFISEHKGEFLSDASTIYRFDGTRWETIADHKIQNLVQNWLTSLLNQLFTLLRYEETIQIQTKGSLPKQMKGYLDMYKAAQKYLGKESNTKNLLATLKRKLGDSDDALKMDKAEYLLGCDDCIVDLKTCTFRKGSPDDLVSMSVGYEAMGADDPDIATAVDDFMTKAYPLVEEKELVRRYFGYCLLGKHNEKVIMFLSDRRQGFNSKSTVMALLELTMGSYAIRTDASMYYKSDKVKSLDDHSAGLMAFEKKRLAMMEESSNTVALWEERVKEFNGGTATITGRGMYSGQMRSFSWITKSLLSANESKLPHFNVEDGALIERLITVPHRSRFVPGSDPLPDEPYTYRADPNIKDNFVAWRPYFLRWILDGLTSYHKQGFCNIPESCQAFKKELVAEKDVVQEFLLEALEEGEVDDFVKVKDLYAGFDEAYRTLQKDKKTRKTIKVFQASVERVLPNKFKARHYYYVNGKRHEATSVLTGHRSVI